MSRKEKVNEILKAHGLDFTIEKVPLSGVYNGENEITPYFGLRNSKTRGYINTTKAGYTVSQNYEIVDMILAGTEKFGDDLKVSKAGSIHEGRRVYVQIEIAGKAKVGNDSITKYITAIDSNDGSTGLSIGVSDEVLRCENQFFKFYAKGEAKFRHTATITQKIERIPFLIETALDESMKQIKVYNQFISTDVSRKLAHDLVKEVLGHDRLSLSPSEYQKMAPKTKGIMEQLYADIETEIKDNGLNLWSLFNGVTRYTTHSATVPKRENGREESLLIGGGYKKNKTAFDFCLANS